MYLDVYLDTICPWCFIGKRRLEQAFALWRGETRPAVRWRPYQLNPEMPGDGMDRASYLRMKFGSDRGAERVYQSIVRTGADEGLHFDFSAIRRTPNTLDSHRLIRLAHHHNLQDRVLERLLQGYFMEGADLGDRKTLARLGEECGLSRQDIESYLAGEDDLEVIRSEDSTARLSGVVGVPCFMGNGRYALPGAQPPEALLRLFELCQQDGDGEPPTA